MAILSKGNTYSSGDPVTADNLNALVDSATFVSGSNQTTDNSTLEVHSGGYLQVKDDGITNAKIATGAVNADSIAADAVGNSELANNAVQTANIADSTGTSDGVTTAKIATNAITAAKISSTDTTFNVDTNVGIGSVNDTGFKLNVDTGTGSSGLQVTGAVANNTVNNFLKNTDTTGHGTLLRFQSNLTGSIANIFHLDLQSDQSAFSLGFLDSDQVGVAILNSNGIAGGGVRTGAFYPVHDNDTDLGLSNKRWDTVFVGTGGINTSDRNEKEEIEELSEAEKRVAHACKGLVRKFKFKGKVRKHIGVIAQDVRDAFSAEGLDATQYGLFCSDTWTDEEGNTVTRLGIRYDELLAFIISAL